jgi:hypothetical protein
MVPGGDRGRIRTLAAYVALKMVLQATNGGIRDWQDT